MSKNKNLSPKQNVIESRRGQLSVDFVLKIEQGTWSSLTVDIACLIDKFEDSIVLYKDGAMFVFTDLFRSLGKDLGLSIKESSANVKFENFGIWRQCFDTFVVHKLSEGTSIMLPKVQTFHIFAYLESQLHNIFAHVKLEDVLSNTESFLHRSNDSRRDSVTTNETALPRAVSLKKRKKVTFPPDKLALEVWDASPFITAEKDYHHGSYPQQVSEEQNSPERSEFAFSNGLSLPYTANQVLGSAFEIGGSYRNPTNPSDLLPPRHPAYEDYNERLKSYARWTHRHPDPITLSKAGFFFTNKVDLVRCYQCGIGLKDFSEGDDPLKEHVRHSWSCSFLTQLMGEPRLEEWRRRLQINDPELNRQMHLTGLRNKVTYSSPEYQTLDARLNSFTNWPAQMMQTPLQLAEAGLYYTGFEDHVRCFACDGGLRRWEAGDDPWTEHCRWFPACPYAKEKKGEGFIALVQAAVALENEDSEISNDLVSRDQDLAGEMEQMVLRDPEYRAALDEHKEACIDMGFRLEDFNEAVQELRKRGTIKPTLEEIMDVLEVVIGRKEKEKKIQTAQNETPVEENQRLKKFIICMKCRKNDVNALFLPCAHHRLCLECAEPLTNCPICEKRIIQKIRTFLA